MTVPSYTEEDEALVAQALFGADWHGEADWLDLRNVERMQGVRPPSLLDDRRRPANLAGAAAGDPAGPAAGHDTGIDQTSALLYGVKGKVSNVDEKLRPIWLLDVDGVINVPWANPPGHVWRGQWTRLERLHQFPFLTAQPVLDFITRVHEDGLAEVRWHTTWQHAAHKIEAEFGLPRFEVQPAPEINLPGFTIRGGHWFKLPAAERLIEKGHTVVWTDDDLRWQALRDRDRIAKLRRTGRLLTIAPDDRTGLTPAHLRKIEAFLRAKSDPGHTEELTTPLQRSTV